MRFQKILCPTDFSPGSEQALRVAIRIADEAGAELVLAHAWHVPPLAFAGEQVFAASLMGELQEAAREALDAAAREAAALGARRLSARMLTGVPRREIVEALERDPAFDLVVMGTHGRTGLARILLGSVAEGVIRHAPCSVLAVRPAGESEAPEAGSEGPEARPEAGIFAFARVLCPVDFSDDSRYAAELAVGLSAGLAAPGSRSITLLHVIDPPSVYARGQHAAELVRALDRYSTEHLDRWAAELAAGAPAPIEKRSRIGHPGAEILHVLDEEPAFDLVVMGSHGRIGLERMLLGSVAEKVVRHARCPVLVARRRAAGERAAGG